MGGPMSASVSSMSADPAGPACWVSVHVYYHHPADELLRAAIGPLVRRSEAAGTLRTWFFLRHWQGGPHLRLRLGPARPGDDESLRQTAIGDLEAYLRERPSTKDFPVGAYAEVAAGLAALEPGSGPVEPMAPNNSLRLVDYDPSAGPVWTTPAPVAQASSRVALSLLDAAMPPGRRIRVALAHLAIAAAALAGTPDEALRRLAGSYELWGAPLLGAHRRAFEVRFSRLAQRGSGLRARLPGLLTTPATGRWGECVRALVAAAAPDMPPGRTWYWLHTHCNRLGLSLPEEAYAHFLLADSARTIGGIP